MQILSKTYTKVSKEFATGLRFVDATFILPKKFGGKFKAKNLSLITWTIQNIIENRCHFLSLIKSIDVKDDFPTSYLCKQPASLTVKFPEVRKRKGTDTESGLEEVGFEIWLDTKRFPIVFYILKVFQSQTPNPTSPQKDLCD